MQQVTKRARISISYPANWSCSERNSASNKGIDYSTLDVFERCKHVTDFVVAEHSVPKQEHLMIGHECSKIHVHNSPQKGKLVTPVIKKEPEATTSKPLQNEDLSQALEYAIPQVQKELRLDIFRRDYMMEVKEKRLLSQICSVVELFCTSKSRCQLLEAHLENCQYGHDSVEYEDVKQEFTALIQNLTLQRNTMLFVL